MATSSKKKVVKVNKAPKPSSGSKKKVVSRKTKGKGTKKASTGSFTSVLEGPLVYGKESYTIMLIGVGLIALGFALMSGGAMPSPDVWEPERIYSFRRITLAPIVILAGLAIQIYAIFKTK